VTLLFDQHGPNSWRIECGERLRANASQQMIIEIRSLLGEDSVRLDIASPVESA